MLHGKNAGALEVLPVGSLDTETVKSLTSTFPRCAYDVESMTRVSYSAKPLL